MISFSFPPSKALFFRRRLINFEVESPGIRFFTFVTCTYADGLLATELIPFAALFRVCFSKVQTFLVSGVLPYFPPSYLF